MCPKAMPKPFAIKAIDDAKVKEGGAGGKRRFELEKWILKVRLVLVADI